VLRKEDFLGFNMALQRAMNPAQQATMMKSAIEVGLKTLTLTLTLTLTITLTTCWHPDFNPKPLTVTLTL